MNSYRLLLLATLDIIKVALPAERRVVGYGEREHGCATLVELDLQRLRGVRRECTHILLQRQPSRLAQILASHKDLQVGSGRSDWARKGQHDVLVMIRQSHVRVPWSASRPLKKILSYHDLEAFT